MWSKSNLCALLVGLLISTATMENNSEVPQKYKIELLYNVAILLLEINLNETKILCSRDISTLMITSPLFKIAKT